MKRGTEKVFGRAARFAVVPIETVRAFNVRTDQEVAEAQKTVDEDMLNALEEMVNAARSERLLDRDSVLSLGAVAW
ncbi:hypothetical protein MZO42_00710 [Sphingomonas psychrotolerans]|uniref:Uncharacterized protein n=1 Tax=Sphingomonas psychrotolerans TaxID=1327635 RepID=A0ABU3MYW1_9SPHN|nr:hypothetical protein [Sphingomonas psychrotolerans]MDT8757206.1 hypothetical protein [Sphingomonas psychrotolerans]